jgi:hypothetical protein
MKKMFVSLPRVLVLLEHLVISAYIASPANLALGFNIENKRHPGKS